MHNLDFQNEKFDIVFMGKVLAYSNNKKRAIEEAKKVLNKNGSLIIAHSLSKTLISNEDVIKKRGYLIASPHNMLKTTEDLNNLVQSLGFKKFYLNVLEQKNRKLVLYGASK